MGNDTEKNQQNPGQRPSNPGNQADPNRQNPTESGKHVYNPQDPTSKSRARTAAQASVRTGKAPRTSKSAAHPNRERDPGT